MIKVEGLQKQYGDFQLNMDLIAPSGYIIGLVGRNGSGKSTFFKLLLQLIHRDSGKIIYKGKDILHLSLFEKEDFGAVLGDSLFSEHLTIEEIRRLLEDFYRNFDGALFDSLVEKMELPTKKKAEKFSTGMKAKLKLLIALTHKPKILLLDEPTSGLDSVAREEILDAIRDYMTKNEDASVIISSHIATDLEKLCDQIYFIHKGKIILQEDTDVLLSDYGLVKITEEKWNILDKSYILGYLKTAYGYCFLTKEKQFYQENYPNIAIENSSIDDFVGIMDKGLKI